MADAIISVVAERLMAILEEKMRNEVRLVRDVKKEARKLSEELRRVRNVLDDAEKKGVKDKNIREWLKKLEYASYEMDDVLDEWNLSLINLQKEQQDSSSAASSSQHKICPVIPRSPCFGFKKIATRRDIALKIKHVKARLDLILEEKNRYHFLENQGTDPRLSKLERVTTSFVEIDNIKGRDVDRDNLVSKIISHSTIPSQGDHQGPIHISSIVGTGGIGKTTLAQLIYNDSRVKNCFPLRIWVCVSDPFDEAKIAKEILEQVPKDSQETPSTNQLQVLLQLVEKSFSGKKFLLILDDVWNGDDFKWGPLKNSLTSSCAVGSRILVTTRNEVVARNIGANKQEIIHLKQLSDDECCSILSHIAFSGKSERMKKELLDISRGIAQKCRGLPLAAKTLGSLLRFKNTVKEWEDVLQNEIWKLESTKVELFPHLLLSYNDLSPIQKRCFSYCAVFPKDHKIDVDDLIGKWMALGYLSFGGGDASELELIGRGYFDSLANRCLFQDFKKDLFSENVISTCKMHDIVHDFAQWLREGDGLKSNEEASSCKICSPLVSRVKEYRSLLLKGDGNSDLHVCDCLASVRVLDCRSFRNKSLEIEKFIHLRKLHFDEVNVNENDIKVICRLYNLQSLVLESCGVREIPGEIGNLSELRHLNLIRNGELKELPKSIVDLHELRSLNVIYCDSLSKLPQGIDELKNLKDLKTFRLGITDVNFLEYPQELAELTSLQSLGMFNGGSDWNELGLLKKLNRLSGSLHLGVKLVDDNDAIVEQAREAELRNKRHLQELTIKFHDRIAEENREEEVSMRRRRRLDIMDALEPHPNLQYLHVYDYKGSRFPEWIASPTFHQLRGINLGRCNSCLSLPHLGKLPCLEVLAIGRIEKVEFVGKEFLGTTSSSSSSSSSSSIGFPKLKKLQFDECPSWKEWEDITVEEQESATLSVMPSLMELKISGCRNLKELPHRLLCKASSLQNLRIDGSPQLIEAYKEGGPLTEFISHIPNVELDSIRESRLPWSKIRVSLRQKGKKKMLQRHHIALTP